MTNLVEGISNEKILRLARLGLAQIYDKTSAKLAAAEEAKDPKYVLDYFNEELDKLEEAFNKLDNAIETIEKEETRA